MNEQDIKALQDQVNNLTKLTISLQQEVADLKEENRLLKLFRFASKSEKWTPEDKYQMSLFNEIENTSEDNLAEDEQEEIVSYKRKKGGRKPFPEDLPRREIVFDIAEKEKKCSCCGRDRPEMAPEVTEELNFIPAVIEVIRKIAKQYGECSCEGFQSDETLKSVIKATTPKRLIPGSITSPSLLAHVITSKFCDAIPLYRQERIFARMGIFISRQTMSNWSLKVSLAGTDLYENLWKLVREGPFINMDETTIQVLHEKSRKPESKSYMWVTVGRHDNHKIVLFNYFKGRGKEIPLKLLDGFKGVIQTDGYDGYNHVVNQLELTHIGCLAHARRKFMKSFKAGKKGGQSKIAIDLIKKIYKIEKELRKENLSEQDFLSQRQESVFPIRNQFRDWLIERRKDVVPSSLLGKAVNYTLNEFEKIFKYLDYDFTTPDNNIAENAIRPFVIGRKNWLFCNTPKGAHSSALLYSLVETAKANNIEPLNYLNKLFERLPEVTDLSQMEALLPWNLIK